MVAQALQSGDKPVDKFLRWFALRPGLTLTLVVLAALGPFITKPFNIDDPLFLWTARQIQAHPANPYGFDVNWYGSTSPMWEVTKNPPLAAYYLAMAAAVLGWSEPALHFAFLLPAVAAILGTYRLARHFCNQPRLAACATLFTPVFLVSSTTLMCDVMMLAFWVWAIVLWVEGMEHDDFWRLTGSGGLIALAAFTKYFGACLIPLLAAYSFIGQRRMGRWAGCFLVPIIALAAYQWATGALYGKGLLSDAGNYATTTKGAFGISGVAGSLTALAFTGGCLAGATFLAPWLWRTRMLAGFTVFTILVAAVVFIEGTMLEKYGAFKGSSVGFVEAQIIFWAVGGVSVLALATADAWHRRDARSCLLALWVLGTFLFAAFFNWIVNARSILPMAPAVGILLARRLEAGVPAGRKIRQGDRLTCFAIGAVLALLVARADFHFATTVRQSAEQTDAEYGQGRETLWFQGHWGFQYYMEKLGAKAVVAKRSVPKPGDFLAVPLNNSNMSPPNSKQAHPWKALLFQGPRHMTTASKEVGAGFYASAWGPLPFAFGDVPPETVLVYVLGSTLPKPQAEQP
jgi:4-amino-4-deoxy-L-arabinose transferase-like glycosyltransferase